MKIKSFRLLVLTAIACGGLAACSTAKAAILSLNPTSDGWINDFGSGENVNYDTATEAEVLQNNLFIGIMKFTLPASLQTATINSVTLTVMPTNATGSFISVAQPTIDWIADEVTYNNPSAVAIGWDGSGGDARAAGLVGADLGTGGQSWSGSTVTWNFSNPGVINDWANNTAVSGLLVHRSAGSGGSGKYATLEDGTLAAPVLTIDYTIVPEPSGFVLIAIGSVIGVMRRRRCGQA